MLGQYLCACSLRLVLLSCLCILCVLLISTPRPIGLVTRRCFLESLLPGARNPAAGRCGGPPQRLPGKFHVCKLIWYLICFLRVHGGYWSAITFYCYFFFLSFKGSRWFIQRGEKLLLENKYRDTKK